MPLAQAVRRYDRAIVLVLAAIVVVVTAFAYHHKVSKGKSAFVRWRPEVLQLVQGVDVYHEHGYPNPPIMAIVLWPFAKLPPVVGAMAFFAIKVVLAVLALAWSLRLAGGAPGGVPGRWGWMWIGLVALLSARMVMSDLQHGNVNIVIMFLVIGSAYAFRQGRDVLSGLGIALGVAFKVTPALLLAYFVYKRQWKVVGSAAAGLVLFLFVVPSLVLGPVRNWELLNAWADVMVWPYVKAGTTEYTYQLNQSVPGLYYRLVTDSVGIEWNSEETTPVNVLALDPKVARWGLRAILVAIVGVLAWLCRTPTGDRRDWRFACEIGLVIIGMLWLSERTWKHHHVTMVLPYACVVAGISIHALSERTKRLLMRLLIASAVLVFTTTEFVAGWLHVDDDGKREGHKYLLAYGAFFLSVVVVFVGLVVALLARPPRVEHEQ